MMEERHKYKEKTKNYYNNRFGNTDERLLNKEEQLRWRLISNYIEDLMTQENYSDLQILDFGCGDGRFSQLLTKYGSVTGVDFADKAIEAAKTSFTDITFYALDASAMNVVDNISTKFDIIVSTEVYEHILDQKQYLDNAYKFLKKNGYMIMTTPNKKWKDQYFEFGKRISDQPFENWVSSKTLKNQLELFSFSVIEKGTFRSEWLFQFKTFGFLRFIGNRFVLKFLKVFKLEKLFYNLFNKLGFGLYLFFLAKK